MKTILLSLLTLAATGCASKGDDPQAQVVTPAPVTYTDASGKSSALSTYQVYSVTAPPVGGVARRAVVVRTTLPNASTLDVTYTTTGTSFPGGLGDVTLVEAPLVDNYGPVPTTRYQAAGVTTGTLKVEGEAPTVVSGTYSGPLTAGGGTVKLVFNKLTI